MAPWWLRSGDDEAWQDNAGSHDDSNAQEAQDAVVTPEPDENAGTEASQDASSMQAHQDAVTLEARKDASEQETTEDTAAERDQVDAHAEETRAAAEESAQPQAEPAAATNEAAAPEGEESAEEDSAAAASDESANEPDAEQSAPKRRKRRRRRRRKRVNKEPAAAESSPETPSTSLVEAPPTEVEAVPLVAEPIATPAHTAATDLDSAPTLDVLRNLVYPLPDRTHSISDERKIAMFCDFENIALGVRDSQIKKLDVNLILERLLEKGKIIVKKAYADWERYNDYKKPFHEAAIELIDIPQKYYSGKNSADIKMVVDAMDLCYSKEHLDTFVLVSGDSDFSPLVSKLKENNKYVIGVGVKNSSSSLLIDNCDEFIFYEDIWRDIQRAERLDNLSPKDTEVFGLMLDAMSALHRENKDVLWGSMIKQTMKRKRPSFNEGYYGYRTFSELLEDAQRKKLIRLKRDQRSGNYVVTEVTHRR